jgi:hypothetical protein
MLSKHKLAKLFSNPTEHVNDIIEDQLERMEANFDRHCNNNEHGNAIAIFQEYAEWIKAEDGERYGFMLMERIF